jgi:hypothetical protein
MATMRTLDQLVDHVDPAFPLIQGWLSDSHRHYEVLEPSTDRGNVLLNLQVTTRSPMGAIAYETGGILIDQGWLRILGSGHTKLPRSIDSWNANRAVGHLLVADDVVGGFFSVNGGNFGNDLGFMYYLAPDTLVWEPLGFKYTDFINWALSDALTSFYESFRWPEWEAEVRGMAGDQCYNFFPFLCSEEGSVLTSSRKAISIAEQYQVNTDMMATL